MIIINERRISLISNRHKNSNLLKSIHITIRKIEKFNFEQNFAEFCSDVSLSDGLFFHFLKATIFKWSFIFLVKVLNFSYVFFIEGYLLG